MLSSAGSAPPSIGVAELQPGDVLLSRGRGVFTVLISALDHARYTHAALWTGDGVIESEPFSVKHRPIHESLNKGERGIVDVFRHRAARREPEAMTRVARAALSFKDAPYAITDVMVLFYVTIKFQSLFDEAQRAQFRAELPAFMAALRAYEGLGERRGLTCCELIARAFTDADATGRYALALHHIPQGAAALHLITPEDLSGSPSLERVGRLAVPDHIAEHQNHEADLAELTDQLRALTASPARPPALGHAHAVPREMIHAHAVPRER